ncbi:MAG TPA: sulfatase-like hydrolase/transferase [Candidatus Tectomicrobia bacterium]
MQHKHTRIGVLLMLAFCFAAGAPKTFAQFPVINPEPIDNPNPPTTPSLPPSGIRNVLLLVVDDMGIDRSRQYIPVTGNAPIDLPATPTMRRLARSGIIFHNAWANPVCSPTRAGVLTGRHAFRTTVTNAIPSGPDLPAAEITLPEVIASAGYVSGLFGKWHLGGGATGPNDQGFAEHRGGLTGALTAYDSWNKYVNGVRVDGNPTTGAIDPVTQYATEANVQDAFDWIDAQTSPWFAMVAFNAAHTPLHTPTATCDGVTSLVPDLNGMIACVDYHIDWLLTELESSGALENTTVIFIGDNGTDSASILGPFSGSPNPSYKGEVYEGGIRVPFIIADGYHLTHGTVAPSSSGLGYISSPDRREEAMVHTVDIFATVARIAGVASTAEDSVSMLPHMGTGSFFFPPFLYARQSMYTERCTSSMYQAAIRNSQYKLIYRYDYNASTLVQELYAVSDLAEVTNLFGTGIADEVVLVGELNSMWASESYDPLTGCP